MSLSVNFTNTATDPVTGARSIAPDPLNFAADWRVQSQSPTEVVLVNIKESVDNPEKIRIAYSSVDDAWKGTGVTKFSGSDISKKGVSLLVQYTGVLSDVVNADGNVEHYPFSVHVVIKVPTAIASDSDLLISLTKRMLGSLYDSGATTANSRLSALVRGALVPIDL